MEKKNTIKKGSKAPQQAKPNVFELVRRYWKQVLLLIAVTLAGNAMSLAVPRLVGVAIDRIGRGAIAAGWVFAGLGAVAVGLLVFSFLQHVIQTLLAERAARDLRHDMVEKLSRQDYMYVERASTAKLLTNLTSDVDAVKVFISQAVASIVSSVFMIIGTAVLLLTLDWQLGLVVLAAVPIIAVAFSTIFSRISKLFLRAQETIDKLNKIINESILGAALIRILNSRQSEETKFVSANTEAKNVGISILKLFASLIPIITFTSNLATVAILALGGHFVISGRMSLGDLSAFYNYMAILIFPIIMIGFMSSMIAQAAASYGRIVEVLGAEAKKDAGTRVGAIEGAIEAKGISLLYGEKAALKNVSLSIKPGTRTALIGPTAAGKTQLLYILVGLMKPASGIVTIDGHALEEYDKASLYRQMGFVFQDSIIFNTTLRENIAFSGGADEARVKKAVSAAELDDFVRLLPEGLETRVSERGASLSGGQKQRIMLARALAIEPRILFLDDFTARLDAATEKKVLENISRSYPGLTLVSVTQKIASVADYDNIILLDGGELIAAGKHDELMSLSPEYVQIYESQRSTSHYELRPS